MTWTEPLRQQENRAMWLLARKKRGVYWAEDASKKRTQLEPMQNYVRTHGHNERSRSLVLKLSVLSGISGGARLLWFHKFRSGRDLWGCSLSSMVYEFSVLSGIYGGDRFLS